MTAVLEMALGYVARGWPVLPLHWITDGRCSCDGRNCASPGKHPLTRNGVHDATTDPDQVRQWYRRWPRMNIGIRTGRQAGLFVVDIDVDHEGIATIARLEATNASSLLTLECETGSGGAHLYYRYPDDITIPNSAGKIGPGIDIRGEATRDGKLRPGYVVAPPSIHHSGRHYRWCTAFSEPQNPPRWLLDLAAKPLDPQPKPQRRRVSLPFTGRPAGPGYVAHAIAAELSSLAKTPAGQCHDALTRSAFRLGQLHHLGGINEDQIVEQLAKAALTNAAEPKSEEAALKTAKECFEAGKDHPREPKR